MGESREVLSGGHSGNVFRQGDKVIKQAGNWTPNVHSLLNALKIAGIEYVPTPHGIDDEGFELLEYVEGEVPSYPLPAWIWSDHLLIDVAKKTRKIHDSGVIKNFGDRNWRRGKIEPTEVMCHGDIAPYNTVFKARQIISFIDWDYAIPAPRGWDLGYAAYRWVSLTNPDNGDGRLQSVDEQRRRLELFASSYGDLTGDEIAFWACRRLDDLISYSRTEALAGNTFMQFTIDEGHVALYERDLKWIQETYL